MRRLLRYTGFLGAMAVTAPLAMTGGAFHPHLRSSDPAAGAALAKAPSEIRLVFSGAINAGLTSIELTDSAGQKITLTPIRIAKDSLTTITAGIKSALVAGRYAVKWKAVGGDGHPVRGDFAFSVGVPPKDAAAAAKAPSPGNAKPQAQGSSGKVVH